MKSMDRREFLKWGGAGLAGLAIGGFDFPIFAPRKAFASDTAWKFGVMADTQWRTGLNAGGEPASCAVSIIRALNEQFIRHGVRYVIQVGDLVDKESVDGIRALPTRAAVANPLYEAGIGFFPVRGNHEGSAIAAAEVPVLFPQTLGGGPHLYGATNFASPFALLNGLSYSFDYGNVRCVLIDQFVRPDGSNVSSPEGSYNANATDQVSWVDEMLRSRPSGSHAFVFSHKNLIGQNHKDVLFGATLTSNPGPRDAFLSSLSENGVRYQMSGHDHMHHRSLVKTSDNSHNVGQVICSSNSYKFYIPRPGDDGRETPLQQEIFSIGYYIVTVDGPRVTVDFYSSSHGNNYGDFDLVTPPGSFAFYLRESFGYSLNGKQFEVARGESYTVVQDAYEGTHAVILGGTNGNADTDYVSRPLTKTVNTGWSSPAPADDAAASNVLSLWGLADNLALWDDPSRGLDLVGLLPNADESGRSDTYVLSMSYRNPPVHLGNGGFGIASKDGNGKWINAVDGNFGGTTRFVVSPWHPSYELGAYGVDPVRKTAWAVINYDGDFVVARGIVPVPGHRE